MVEGSHGVMDDSRHVLGSLHLVQLQLFIVDVVEVLDVIPTDLLGVG